MYIPPLKRFMESIGNGPAGTVAMDMLRMYMRAALAEGGVDEAWYLQKYPDVAAAISRGECPSAHEHFCAHGYFEDRRPRIFVVDEAWYAQQYRDVYADVRRGVVRSATEHYNNTGWSEGRAPTEPDLPLVTQWNDLITASRQPAGWA
jgi:hypothetical protein